MQWWALPSECDWLLGGFGRICMLVNYLSAVGLKFHLLKHIPEFLPRRNNVNLAKICRNAVEG